jgi:hypothetical protein
MKWCCATFRGWFEEAGNRGFGVVVDSTTTQPSFLLQHRSVEMDDAGPANHPRPLTLVGQLGILFCPWCGVNLAAFYGAEVKAMERPAYRLDP